MADAKEVLYAVLDTSGFTAGQLKINIAITQINQTLESGQQAMAAHQNKMNSLRESAEVLAGTFGILAASFTVDKLIETNSEYDRLSVALQTATGSAAGAHQAMQGLITFANQTPYTLTQVTDAFIELRNSGLDSSTGMLESLSNVASSIGRPLGDITRAIASAAVGNTEALRGFGIELQASGDKFTATFQGMSHVIDRNGPAIEHYISNLGNTVFAGDTQRQSQTISGLTSTLEDSVQNVMRAVGDGGFNDAFKGLLKDVTDANNGLVGMAGTIGGVLGNAINDGRSLWHDYGQEIDAAAVGIGTVVAAGTALAGLETILTVLSAIMSPWALAIGGAAAAVMYYKDQVIVLDGQPMTVLQAISDTWKGILGYIQDATGAVENFGSKTDAQGKQQSKGYLGRAGDVISGWADSIDKWEQPFDDAIENPVQWDRYELPRLKLENQNKDPGAYNFKPRDGETDWEHLADVTFDHLQKRGQAYENNQPVGTPAAPVTYQTDTAHVDALPRAVFGHLPQADEQLQPGVLSAHAQAELQAHPDWLQTAQQTAQQYHLPINAFLRQMDIESDGFDPNARSPTGAVGLAQVVPSTAANPGYGVSPLLNSHDPNASIRFAGQYLHNRAEHEQHPGNEGVDLPIDFMRAAQSYGTLSLAGNLNNPAALQQHQADLIAAMKLDDPQFQYLAQNPQSQAMAAIANFQSSLYPASLHGAGSGAEKAQQQALIRAGFATPVDPNDPYSITRAERPDEVAQQYADGKVTQNYVRAYGELRGFAGQQYDTGIANQQDKMRDEVADERRVAAMTEQGHAEQMMAEGLTAYNNALQAGQSPTQAHITQLLDMQKAQAALNQQVAQGIQSSKEATEQTAAQTAALSQQKIVWDDVSQSYIADTRASDALAIKQRIDPYNLNPHSGEVANQEASANWDKQRAQEDAQDRLQHANMSDPTEGMSQAWHQYQDVVNNVSEDTRKTFSDAMSGMNQSLAQFVVTGKGNFGQLAQSVEEDITEMSIHYLESAIFKSVGNALGGGSGGGMGGSSGGGGIFGSLFSLFGGGGSSGPTNLMGSIGGASEGVGAASDVGGDLLSSAFDIGSLFATGGVTTGISDYSGTIVSEPTRFRGEADRRYADGGSLMGEAGPEAILPLKRGSDGKLGIAGGGGGGSAISVGDIHIHNPNVTDGKLDEDTMRNLHAQLSKAMDTRLASFTSKMTRPGGQFYGVNR